MKVRGFLRHILGQERGQTAVEYILLLLVLVSIIVPLMIKLKEHFLSTEDGSCTAANVNKSLICFFKRGIGPNYKIYRLP